ncbi:phosphomevalonate kinase [Entomortierella beljakovae]|nr:phosphomevalonate kinase [Entomortierella beljakovae]
MCFGSNNLDENLNLAKEHMERSQSPDIPRDIKIKHCHKALRFLKKAEKRFLKEHRNQPLKHEKIANCYHEHYILLSTLNIQDKPPEESQKKAEDWGYVRHDSKISTLNSISSLTSTETSPTIPVNNTTSIRTTVPTLPCNTTNPSPTTEQTPNNNPQYKAVFTEEVISDDHVDPHSILKPSDSGHHLSVEVSDGDKSTQRIFQLTEPPSFTKPKLPETDAKLESTIQLAYTLSLLNNETPLKEKHFKLQLEETRGLEEKEISDPEEQRWLRIKKKELKEVRRLERLASDVVRTFLEDKRKSVESIREIVYLAPVLRGDEFQAVLKAFVNEIKKSGLLETQLLEGLSQLLQNPSVDRFNSGDLVSILNILRCKLDAQKFPDIYQRYTLAVTTSRVLDGMLTSGVKDLPREDLHQPFIDLFLEFKSSDDPCLAFQAAYAIQALLYIANDETKLREGLRRTGKVVQGVFGLMSSIKSFDVNNFINGLKQINEGALGPTTTFIITAFEKFMKAAEDGQTFGECIAQGFSFPFRKAGWYPVLRALDSKMESGQFTEFETLVREAPCSKDPAFRWGVCQRLGEIAADKRWEENTRKNAIDLLKELYGDVTQSNQAKIKHWILHIVHRIKAMLGNNDSITEHAMQVFDDLKGENEEYPFNDPNRMNILLVNLIPESFPLLDQVQALRPDLEAAVDKLKTIRRNKNKTNHRLAVQDNEIYVPLKAKKYLHAEEEVDVFDLMPHVLEFVDSEKKVFLLRGSSGSGKSTFNRKLELELWDNYKSGGKIPLFIHLPTIKDVDNSMIEDQLQSAGIDSVTIGALKMGRKFLIICDGYDECQSSANLYNKYAGSNWDFQMVISCRTDYHNTDYQYHFTPTNINGGIFYGDLLQEAVIVPLDEKQIDGYVMEFTKAKRSSCSEPSWTYTKYHEAFEDVPNLRNLTKNPFVLKMAMEVLPSILNEDSIFSDSDVTRVEMYDRFMKEWLQRSKIRLMDRNMKVGTRDHTAFESVKEHFETHGIKYVMNLALAIYSHQEGRPSVKFNACSDSDDWEHEFFGNNCRKNMLLRDSVPLFRDKNTYQFIHTSYLEYGLSLAVFNPKTDAEEVEPVLKQTSPPKSPPKSPKRSDSLEVGPITPPKTDAKKVIRDKHITRLLASPLGAYRFVIRDIDGSNDDTDKSSVDQEDETSDENMEEGDDVERDVEEGDVEEGDVEEGDVEVQEEHVQDGEEEEGMGDNEGKYPTSDGLKFLVDRARKYGEFRSQLLAVIEQSKIEYKDEYKERSRTAAANAITILVKTGFQFNGYDLRGVRIPRADLSYGVFDSARFDGADLRRTILRNVWFRGSCFNGAKMSNVFFGERPYIEEVETEGTTPNIESCYYSPDGKLFALVLTNSKIKVYDITSWKLIHEFKGIKDEVTALAFSPTGSHVAIGGVDTVVRIYEILTGNLDHTLDKHKDKVTSLSYSPDGKYLASGSCDDSILVWNPQSDSKKPVYIGLGYKNGSKDGHKDEVTCVTFSRNGLYYASGSSDSTVKLWDGENGNYLRTFESGNKIVETVIFSPTEDQMLSSGTESILKIWNVDTGDLIRQLPIDNMKIGNALFSPNGRQIAFTVNVIDQNETENNKDDQNSIPIGDGSTVIWDPVTNETVHTLNGHTGAINSIMYSPDGKRIASGGADKKVLLWDTENGKRIQTLDGHTEGVDSVIYSPRGDMIASCDRNKARHWKVNTGLSVRAFPGHSKEIRSISIIGDKIASGSKDGSIRIWKYQKGEPLCNLPGPDGPVECVVNPSDINRLVAVGGVGNNKTIRFWEVTNKNKDQMITSSSGKDEIIQIWEADTSKNKTNGGPSGNNGGPSGNNSGPSGNKTNGGPSENKTSRLWNADTSKDMTLPLSANVTCTASSSSGQIALGRSDMTISLWDIKNGASKDVLSEHLEGISCLAYSQDGAYIVSECTGGLKLWDSTGMYIRTLDGSNNKTMSITFSQKGDMIASCSDDRAVRIWHTKSGPPKVLNPADEKDEKEDEYDTCIAFSPCGKFIVTGSSKSTFILWDLDSGKSRVFKSGGHGKVLSLVLREKSSTSACVEIIAGSEDGSVRRWTIIKEKQGEYSAKLKWSSSHDVLNILDASFKGVIGLSKLNKLLLNQRKAVSEPSDEPTAVSSEEPTDVSPTAPSEASSEMPPRAKRTATNASNTVLGGYSAGAPLDKTTPLLHSNLFTAPPLLFLQKINRIISAPGKVLVAGGYLVLERAFSGLVLATDARFYTLIRPNNYAEPNDHKYKVTVRSPQFENATWNYWVDINESTRSVKVSPSEQDVSKNTFVELALEYSFGILGHLIPVESIVQKLATGLDIVIAGNNDFYSQRNELKKRGLELNSDSLRSIPLFAPTHTTLKEVSKTGLGSSASLITSLVSALFIHFGASSLQDNNNDDGTRGKTFLHNTAQFVHCLAQGKVGSGFDVSSAVWGSHTYRRFSPEILQEVMHHEAKDNIPALIKILDPKQTPWDNVVTPFKLPLRLHIMLADIDAGSHTPTLVSNLLKWRKTKPEESIPLWEHLGAANDEVVELLSKLDQFAKGDERSLQEYHHAIERASKYPASSWKDLDQLDTPTELLIQVYEKFSAVRNYLREMSHLSGVPVEPEEQTRLLDACLTVPGVLMAGVPGAGGFDAIFCIVLSDQSRNGVEDVWSNFKEMSVGPLLCQESAEDGIVVELGPGHSIQEQPSEQVSSMLSF